MCESPDRFRIKLKLVLAIGFVLDNVIISTCVELVEYTKTNFIGANLASQYFNCEIEYVKIHNILLQASWILMSVKYVEKRLEGSHLVRSDTGAHCQFCLTKDSLSHFSYAFFRCY